MWKRIGIAAGVLGCLLGPTQADAALTCGDFLPCLASPASSETVYTVRSGDTLWSIARAHETTPAALVFANQVEMETPLRIGQTLEVPASGTTSYAIQSGDTLWSIAQRYHTTCETLLHLNPALSAENLTPGESLALPESAVRELPSVVSRQRTYGSGYAWPLVGVITSPFGERSLGTHHGIDIAGSTGDLVRASAAGTVRKAEFHEIYGNMVLLDHPNGQQTLYGHLSKSCVEPGEKVLQGQKIGWVGSTGRSTGPHLHFEIRLENLAVNPMPYLPR